MSKYPYVPHTEEDIRQMLETIGIESVEELFEGVPKSSRELDLPTSSDEFTVKRRIEELSRMNVNIKGAKAFLMGAGVYRRYIPSVVEHLSSNPAFVTAYTPYQAEVSQGTLQALFEFQTMICELTGMEVANSSMYDGASALAEAALMAIRIAKKSRVLLSSCIHPEYRRVARTYLSAQGFDVEEVAWDEETGQTSIRDLKAKISADVAAFAVQYPNFFGVIEDLAAIRESLPRDIVFIVVSEPVALAVLEPPGKFGADIVIGEGQSLGLPPAYGGPGFGFFATLKKHVWKMPGRIVGQTKDAEGKTGYVMILQAREQHIRRAKATSNICSNHAHCAVFSAIYMATMGVEGLREVAYRGLNTAHIMAERFEEAGFKLRFRGPFFNEFVVEMGRGYMGKWRKLAQRGIFGPVPLDRCVKELSGHALACATEATSPEEIEAFLEAIANDNL